ncbi:MAG: SIS domain-containing protein [Pseudobdellovibrionaceae bacterium]
MNVIEEALRVLDIEAQAILSLKKRIGPDFERAVQLIMNCQGKVIITGMGKSGQIGRKIASTLASTGTPALFVHPAESSHGDLGVVASGDVVIAISNGGESPELSDLIGYVSRKGIPLIGMTGKKESTLGRSSQVILDISVEKEACPLKLAPTASSAATLAMGDALAMALLSKRGFSPEEFAEFHPGGSLGKKLLTRVTHVMHKESALPLVHPETPMKQVVSVMTAKDVRGVAGVTDSNGNLVGVITDGDLRRRLEKSQDPLQGTASEIMSHNPKTIDTMELAEKALFVMEQFQIQLLFVVDQSSSSPKKPVGLLHLQDLLKAKVR